MTVGYVASQFALIVSFKKDPLRFGERPVSFESEATDPMMRVGFRGSVVDEKVRDLGEIRMEGQANQTSFPVVIHLHLQHGFRKQALIFQNQDFTRLVQDQDAFIRRESEGGRRIDAVQ